MTVFYIEKHAKMPRLSAGKPGILGLALILIALVVVGGEPAMADEACLAEDHEMPCLEELSRADAIAELQRRDIDYQVVYSDQCGKHDAVIRTDPTGGFDFGDEARFAILVVNEGDQVAVPDIVGVKPAEAKKRAQRAGFVFDRKDRKTNTYHGACKVYVHDKFEETISRQRPKEGEFACSGDTLIGYRRSIMKGRPDSACDGKAAN